MKSIILTSDPGFFDQKDNEEKKAVKLANLALVETLKREVEKYDNLLFICSSPDEYEKNEKYMEIVTKSLSLSGLKFKMADLIDSRNWLFSKGLINNSDLIIFLGGDPIEQMEFFNSIDLKEKLKKYKGCLMGISKSSINMANNVYCSKDDSIECTIYYRGLGVSDVNVEPHFNVNDKQRINEVLLIDSKKRPFVALPDESFIVIKKDNINLFGDAYYFKDGEYRIIKDNIDDLFKGGK